LSKYVNVCGFGLTGSTAVVDLLSEIENTSRFPFELDIYRAPGGIANLEYHLSEDWSLINSGSSIEDFERLCTAFSKNSRLHPAGMNYEKRFNNKFINLTQKFLDEIIEERLVGRWHFNKINQSYLSWLKEKILFKLNFNLKTIYFSAGTNFYEKSQEYIDSLINIHCNFENEFIILHNFFEPTQYLKAKKYLHNGKTIVVDRDIRDSFVDLQKYSFSGAQDVESFVYRSKITREKFYQSELDNDEILVVSFEELILDYDNQIKKIFEFLNIDSKHHIRKNKYLNINKSKNNIGIWKVFKNNSQIKQLEELLPSEYFYKEKRK
jgi:hypothetical protein